MVEKCLMNRISSLHSDKNSPQAVIHFCEYASVNSKMLRLMGLVVRVENNKRDRRSQILEKLPTVITNIICVMDAIFQIQWIVDLWKDDKDLVMQITTSGISNIVCICKVRNFIVKFSWSFGMIIANN